MNEMHALMSRGSQEAALKEVVDSESSGGRCGGPWRHELTPVVKHCGVATTPSGDSPVLLVNPTWLRELVARDELGVLAAEMRTWFAINSQLAPAQRASQPRRPAA